MSDPADDYSISLEKANVVSLLLFVPISAVFIIPYGLFWGWAKTGSDFTVLLTSPWLFLVLIIAGIAVHELLHGLTWMWFGNKPWSAIKFGVNWKVLTPYAHCREPLEITAYRWGAAMPGLVLGLFPYAIGIATGYAWFVLFGFLFSITASGDIIIMWAVRKLPPGTYVMDHPERAGCKVVSGDVAVSERSI